MTILHNIPAAEYFSRPEYSASDLFAFADKTLRDVRAGLIPPRYSEAMRLGTLAHLFVLEPARYAKEHVLRPETYHNGEEEKAWNNNAKACKAWYEQQELLKMTVVTRKQHDVISRMHERMPAEVRSALEHGESEVSVYTTLPGFSGLPVRCRPDRLNGRQIIDLKTIRNIGGIRAQVATLQYHVRAEFYRLVMKAATGLDHTFTFIFAETNAPYRWRIGELDEVAAGIGRQRCHDLLGQLANAHASGDWTDRDPARITISLPEWATADFFNHLMGADEDAEL